MDLFGASKDSLSDLTVRLEDLNFAENAVRTYHVICINEEDDVDLSIPRGSGTVESLSTAQLSTQPSVCFCREKFLLGTIRRDQSCLTRACRPVASDLGGPAPEPAPPKKSVGKTPPKTAPASVVKAPPTIIEVTPPSSSAASRQADIVLDNAQTQSAGFVAGTSLIIATAVAMLVL